MKNFLISICGEADHPLLPQFYNHYSKIFGFKNIHIEMGCVEKWIKVNGNTSETNNVFPDKTAQQNAALEMVPYDVDYIFYFDIDEFITFNDYLSTIPILHKHQPSTAFFQMNHFWKDNNHIGIGGDGWAYDAWCPRIFKNIMGSKFKTHRPPVLETPRGVNLLTFQPLNLQPKINHYSYIYPLYVERKMKYYAQVYPQFATHYEMWFNECFLKWTPENKNEIESKHSVHPSCSNAITQKYDGGHDVKI